MKFQVTKGEQSVILTVFIQDNTLTTGLGLGSLDQTSSITGGYVKRGGTGVALAVDQNVTTEGTYEAPSTAAQVRIGTPANMITGTYELHFHNDLFTTNDWVTVTLSGATDMAPLTLEIQLVSVNPNLTSFGLVLTNANLAHVDSNERVAVGRWLSEAVTLNVNNVPEIAVSEWENQPVTVSAGTLLPQVDIESIDNSGPAALNLKNSCLAMTSGAVVAAEAAANTATVFDTNLPLENDDYYGSATGGNVLAFIDTETNQVQTRRIVGSATGTLNTRITVEEAFDAIPIATDAFIVIGRITEI